MLGLVLVGVVIQFIPVSRTNPPVEGDIPTPPEVKAILRASCYDCHSNETVWPWYSRVAPVSWLVSSDASEGRGRFNFSTWNRYDPQRQAALRARIIREVRGGDMPPWYYTIKHTGAKLDAGQRALLEAWAAQPQ
ncbi:MAG: heme-binding domain-containing protein [Holophaga sp.]|nr:heme-binding domain-containing protein [Holophaga sp.]